VGTVPSVLVTAVLACRPDEQDDPDEDAEEGDDGAEDQNLGHVHIIVPRPPRRQTGHARRRVDRLGVAMEDLVRVAVVDNEPEAELTVSMLRNEGIRAMWRTTDAAAAGLGGGTSSGIGPLAILVLPDDAERARELVT
jgi:hypothetical protein